MAMEMMNCPTPKDGNADPVGTSVGVETAATAGGGATLENLAQALVDARKTALDKRDAARRYSTAAAAATTTTTSEKRFAEILFYALEDEENADILTWLPGCDSSFTIIDTKKFAAEKMLTLFNIRVLSSFNRKLNQWGFKRGFDNVTMNSDIYSHPLFRKGQPGLLKQMRRSNHRENATATTDATVPRIVGHGRTIVNQRREQHTIGHSDEQNSSSFIDSSTGSGVSSISGEGDSDSGVRSSDGSTNRSTAQEGGLQNHGSSLMVDLNGHRQTIVDDQNNRIQNHPSNSDPLKKTPPASVAKSPPSYSIDHGSHHKPPRSIDIAIESLLKEREKLLKDTNANALALKALMDQRDRYQNNEDATATMNDSHNSSNNHIASVAASKPRTPVQSFYPSPFKAPSYSSSFVGNGMHGFLMNPFPPPHHSFHQNGCWDPTRHGVLPTYNIYRHPCWGPGPLIALQPQSHGDHDVVTARLDK